MLDPNITALCAGLAASSGTVSGAKTCANGAMDEVLLEAHVAIHGQGFALQGAAAVVAALPARVAMRSGDEDAPVVCVEFDAHDASVIARIHLMCLVASAVESRP
jgi:hypothetical protein